VIPRSAWPSWRWITELQPGIKLLPSPLVHSDLATLATPTMADEHRSALALEVSLGECQGFADPKTGSPKNDGQPPKAQSRRPRPGQEAWPASVDGLRRRVE
jgi:hypothetical protein